MRRGSGDEFTSPLNGPGDHRRVGLDRIADDAGIVDVAMPVDARDLKSSEVGPHMEAPLPWEVPAREQAHV